MRYVCLGYMDAQAWEALSLDEREAFLAECRAYDELLAESGHVVAREALDCEENAATLKLSHGGAAVNPGCLAAAARPPLRGILVIEANDMNHAIQLLSRRRRRGPPSLAAAAGRRLLKKVEKIPRACRNGSFRSDQLVKRKKTRLLTMPTQAENLSLSANERTTVDIVNVRLFDVSPTKLFEAFSDPNQLAKWWGPEGFTNTIHEFDFRPGGAWHLTMHGPNGTDFENESQIVEFEKPGRIVFEHLRPFHWYRMTMTHRPVGERTELKWVMNLEASPDSEKMKAFIEQANEQNFDRLAMHLTSIAAPGSAGG